MLTQEEVARLTAPPDFDRMKRESARVYGVALAVCKEARARGERFVTVKEVCERAKCSAMGAQFAFAVLAQRGAIVTGYSKAHGVTYQFVARER